LSAFVLDCSVTMAWCFRDESDEYADEVLGALASRDGFVPSIWPLEVANVLLTAERRRRLEQAYCSRFIELLGDLSIVVDEETTARAWTGIFELGRRFRLSAYDAAYLELALRRGLPLATRDRALRSALKSAGGSLLEA
jgi:predicted nucleic acid-binding protein